MNTNCAFMFLTGHDINSSDVIKNCKSQETQFTRKKSITVKLQQSYIEEIRMNTVGGEIPNFPDERWDKEKETFIDNVKDSIKASIVVENNEAYRNHLNSLVKQGEFLKLSQLEQQDANWKDLFLT